MLFIEYLLSEYGYLAIFLCVFFEGKTAILVSGLVAHYQSITIEGAIIASFLGMLIVDHIFYFIGRIFLHYNEEHQGDKIHEKKVNKIKFFFNKSPFLTVLIFRFIPGCRVVAPVTLGMLNFSRIKFFIYDFFVSAITAIVLVFAGYYLGDFVKRYITGTHKYDLVIGLIVIIIVVVIFLYRKWKVRSWFK